jgi:hypothetical protein
MGIDCSGKQRSANRLAKELARLQRDDLAVSSLMAAVFRNFCFGLREHQPVIS